MQKTPEKLPHPDHKRPFLARAGSLLAGMIAGALLTPYLLQKFILITREPVRDPALPHRCGREEQDAYCCICDRVHPLTVLGRGEDHFTAGYTTTWTLYLCYESGDTFMNLGSQMQSASTRQSG